MPGRTISCFPGQERLAKDMGVTDRSVRTYLQELEREQFIAIKQRGLGKPNLYELNLSASAADRKNISGQDRKKTGVLTGNIFLLIKLI